MWAKKTNPSFEEKMDWFIKNGWISNINKGGIKESVNEALPSQTKWAVAIASLTATRPEGVQKFIDDNNLDSTKLYSYLKKGKLSDKMDFVTAMVGNPGNKIQKMIISKFGIKEVVSEAPIPIKDGKYHFYYKDGVGYLEFNGKKISSGDYDMEDGSNSYWMSHSSWRGQKAFDTGKDIINYFKSKKITTESVNESTPDQVIKDLDKAKNDLLKKVDALIAKKKKLYSDVDIEAPMSADEKKLDKDIADLFSQINKLVLQKRSVKKESVNEALLPADTKVVKAFFDKKPLEGRNLNTDGKVLKTAGIGSQEMYTHTPNGVKMVGKITGKYAQSLVQFVNKNYKSDLVESVNEASMSDIDIIAQEAKDFKDFVIEFYKEYKDFPKTKESMKWLAGVYKNRSKMEGLK
jgi:hypothetical protein